MLLRNAGEAREIRKELRRIEKQLAAAGYSEDELSVEVINNIDFARANMKMNIYDQAVLEGDDASVIATFMKKRCWKTI